jgi:lysophospholipid acyltransferase (LPLAT)-like uncharacterized protein
MRNQIHHILASPIFHRVLYLFIRFYSRTFRLRVVNEARWQKTLADGSPVLLCAWHQQFFGAIRHFKNYAPYRPQLMISQSRDGSIIAAVAHQSGWQTARGSSSRGGKTALRAMITHLKASNLGAHILDGPTGPMGVVKAGAIRLAHASRAAIVPVSISAKRAFYFNSWDRFMLPAPFSRVVLTFGDPVRFEPTDDPEAFEAQRLRLEAIMAPLLITGRQIRKGTP